MIRLNSYCLLGSHSIFNELGVKMRFAIPWIIGVLIAAIPSVSGAEVLTLPFKDNSKQTASMITYEFRADGRGHLEYKRQFSEKWTVLNTLSEVTRERNVFELFKMDDRLFYIYTITKDELYQNDTFYVGEINFDRRGSHLLRAMGLSMIPTYMYGLYLASSSVDDIKVMAATLSVAAVCAGGHAWTEDRPVRNHSADNIQPFCTNPKKDYGYEDAHVVQVVRGSDGKINDLVLKTIGWGKHKTLRLSQVVKEKSCTDALSLEADAL